MQAFLDGKPLNLIATSFGDAVNEANAIADEMHQIIYEARADGTVVSDEHLEDSSLAGLQPQRVEFVSVSRRQLVATTFKSAADVLADARATQLAAAEQLQLGEQEKAFEVLGPVLETWGSIQRAVQSSADILELDVESLGREAAVELKPLIAALTIDLGELKHAIESKDWSSAADSLAYDLDVQCEHWVIALRKLAIALIQKTDTQHTKG